MQIINLPKITDNRGSLSFLESQKHIPFKIQAAFLLTDCGISDSYSFHKKNNAQFCFIALSGAFRLKTEKIVNTESEYDITVNTASKVLCTNTYTDFRISDFAQNTVILILTSMKKVNFKKN